MSAETEVIVPYSPAPPPYLYVDPGIMNYLVFGLYNLCISSVHTIHAGKLLCSLPGARRDFIGLYGEFHGAPPKIIIFALYYVLYIRPRKYALLLLDYED